MSTCSLIVIHDTGSVTYNKYLVRGNKQEAIATLGSMFHTEYDVLFETPSNGGTLMIIKTATDQFAATVYNATGHPFYKLEDGINAKMIDD